MDVLVRAGDSNEAVDAINKVAEWERRDDRRVC